MEIIPFVTLLFSRGKAPAHSRYCHLSYPRPRPAPPPEHRSPRLFVQRSGRGEHLRAIQRRPVTSLEQPGGPQPGRGGDVRPEKVEFHDTAEEYRTRDPRNIAALRGSSGGGSAERWRHPARRQFGDALPTVERHARRGLKVAGSAHHVAGRPPACTKIRSPGMVVVLFPEAGLAEGWPRGCRRAESASWPWESSLPHDATRCAGHAEGWLSRHNCAKRRQTASRGGL